MAYAPPFHVLSPKAMAHNTPLYPIKPAFIAVVSTPNNMATGIGSNAPKTV